MKRNIICYLSSLAFALASVSCGDFLDKNPDLRTTLDSEEKIANILVSAYVSGSGSYQIVAELSSDNVCDRGITKNYSQFYEDVYEWAENVTTGNDSPRNIWSANYGCSPMPIRPFRPSRRWRSHDGKSEGPARAKPCCAGLFALCAGQPLLHAL